MSEGFSWVFDLVLEVRKSLLISSMAAGGYIPGGNILGRVCRNLLKTDCAKGELQLNLFWFYMQRGLRNDWKIEIEWTVLQMLNII